MAAIYDNFILHGDTRSGNCQKIRWIADLCAINFTWCYYDVLALKTTKNDALYAKNPNGKLPFIELQDGRILTESNAILWYIARNSPYVPNDAWQQALIMQWLCFEQYSHEPYIGTNRYFLHIAKQADAYSSVIEKNAVQGHKALEIMESQLVQTPFLTGSSMTIADIALFAYTHVAHQGNYDMSLYPHINAWLDAIKAYNVKPIDS